MISLIKSQTTCNLLTTGGILHHRTVQAVQLVLQSKFRTREERLGFHTKSMVHLVTTIIKTPPAHLVHVVHSCKCQETSTSFILYILL